MPGRAESIWLVTETARRAERITRVLLGVSRGLEGGGGWMKVPTTTQKSIRSHRLARSGLNQDANTFIASPKANTWRDGDESFKPNEQAAASGNHCKA